VRGTLCILALGFLLAAWPAAQAQAPARFPVIVGHRAAAVPEAQLSSQAAVNFQRGAIGQMTQAVLNSMPAGSATSIKQFETIPFFAVEVDAAGLAALRSSPLVASIEEDVAVPPTLAQSAPLVQATDAASAGFTGAGWTVAILDTGVLKTHDGLTVVSEACYSTNSATSTSFCPGAASSSTGNDSGLPCTGVSSCDHGTHVAGIAAGNMSGLPGVARGATIIAIQVFSRFTSGCGTGVSACPLSRTSDRVLAHERVLALSSQFNIASVNMSIGGGGFSSPCGSSAEKTAIDNLRAAGIATVVSSGNDSTASAISYPACISSAVSVGSTTKSDVVSSFSNAASFLSLLAPGSSITSAVITSNTATGIKSGTSMAAPHVTGAWAILKQFRPTASVTEALAVLRATGESILDSRNGLTFPRIRIKAAIDSTPLAFAKSSPSAGTTGLGTSVTLGWAASSWLDGYEYCVDTSNNNQCDGSWTSTGTTAGASLTGLTTGRTYYWQARASNSMGTTAADSNTWWSFATAAITNPAMAVDTPFDNTTVTPSFTISGWAVDRAAASGTGVDTLHVWAFPSGSSTGQFVGVPTYGSSRGDIGSALGGQFTNSGFTLNASLTPGSYLLLVYSHSSVTGNFEQVIGHNIVVQAPATDPFTRIDQPAFNDTRSRSSVFTISGWAIDRGATSGAGVDTVHIWAFRNGQQPGTFVCVATYGQSRPDIGTAFGNSRFNNSGYSCNVNPSSLGFQSGDQWFFVVFGHSTVTGAFSQSAGAWVTFTP
jgi:subtilisin